MMSVRQLEDYLVAFVQTKGFDHDRERVGSAVVRSISPQIYNLIRTEVANAKREALAKGAS